MSSNKLCKKALIFFVLIFPPVLFLTCDKAANKMPNETLTYNSLREIPGVTEAEINAVNALRNKGFSFTYGMAPGTEAFYDADGSVRGFSALFCEWLTSLFEIDFNPAIYEWGDLIAGLESGAIDFSGDLTPTEERRKTYYMSSAIIQRTLKHYRIRGRLPLSEIAKIRPLRFAFLEGSVTPEKIISSQAFLGFESVFIKDHNPAHDLLKNNLADAFFDDSSAEVVFDPYGDVVAETFYPMVFNPVSLTTQKAALEPVISIMEKILQNGGLRYLAGMYNQGNKDYLRNKLYLQLNEEERAYLKMAPVVRFAAEIDNYPNCFFNTQEKQWQGIAFDVMSEIEALTGLSFKLVNANNQQIDWSLMVKMLEDGEVSMLTDLIQSEDRQERFIWPDKTIITENYALLSKSEHPNINIGELLYIRVGLPKGTAYTELFKDWFPDHKYTYEYDSSGLAFNALDRGEVDMVMSSQYRFLFLTNYRGLPDYKANVVFDRTFNSTFGFNKDEEVLCSIVDKALALVDTKGISGQWMRRTFDYRVKLMQTQIPWFISATALVLGLFFLLFLFHRKRGESKKFEKLVMERTNELHKSQHELEMMLKGMKAANQAKSSFLANMSHEIRTPMNSIMGFSELALDGENSPKTRDYLENIITNAEWLLQIINDILDISKIESGKMELENIPFEMHELFTSCRMLVMPKAVEKGIQLYFYAEPSIGKRPMGDPTRLRQVLVNLLSNAIKFTNNGMIKLHAIITGKTDKTISMHFEVKDSGIGMTSEQIRKIFEPFMQAETGTTRQYGGTGLGLSITKNIVEMMGGSLTVESNPGIGSKFGFNLTFDTIDLPAEKRIEHKNMFAEVEKPVFEGEVLLCEDNEMNQRVICEHLARVGLKTYVAENGKIGVDMVKERIAQGKKPFNLIFMDMHMPVMDGLEAATEILGFNTGVPIVAMTANIMSDDRDIYKRSGIPDCVGKPFTSQELWRCLLKYFTPVSEPQKEVQMEFELEFQKRLQLLFVNNNKKIYSDIVEALETNNITQAYRLTHNLKGNAGQMGLTLLQQAATEVEINLKEGMNNVKEEQLKTLEREIKMAISQIAEPPPKFTSILADQSKTGQNIEGMELLDDKVAVETFDKLEKLLKGGNPECVKLIGELRLIPWGDDIKITELREQIIQQIEDFDFLLALSTLVKLRKKWK